MDAKRAVDLVTATRRRVALQDRRSRFLVTPGERLQGAVEERAAKPRGTGLAPTDQARGQHTEAPEKAIRAVAGELTKSSTLLALGRWMEVSSRIRTGSRSSRHVTVLYMFLRLRLRPTRGIIFQAPAFLAASDFDFKDL